MALKKMIFGGAQRPVTRAPNGHGHRGRREVWGLLKLTLLFSFLLSIICCIFCDITLTKEVIFAGSFYSFHWPAALIYQKPCKWGQQTKHDVTIRTETPDGMYWAMLQWVTMNSPLTEEYVLRRHYSFEFFGDIFQAPTAVVPILPEGGGEKSLGNCVENEYPFIL